MKKQIVILLCILASFLSLSVHSQTLKKNSRVPAAKIPESESSQEMVLATPHLRSYGEHFNHDALKALLDALIKYHPDLIAIESAANIRRAMAIYPGKKMLVIIGATHKIFLEALLAECIDVKIVQLNVINILKSRNP